MFDHSSLFKTVLGLKVINTIFMTKYEYGISFGQTKFVVFNAELLLHSILEVIRILLLLQ